MSGRHQRRFRAVKASSYKQISRYPGIVLSSSGMCEGGLVVEHLCSALLDEEFTIVLTGYQSPGTNGSKLLGLMKEPSYEAILLLNGKEISTQDVRAKIVFFGGYSGHATPGNMIENHLSCLNGREGQSVFLNHGTSAARESFKQMIEGDERTKHLDVILPEKGETYILSGSKPAKEIVSDADAGASGFVDILVQINQNLVEIKELLRGEK